MASRKEKRERSALLKLMQPGQRLRPKRRIVVDPTALARHCPCCEPGFVRQGYYEDLAFDCRDCGARQVWTAEQQQWWYETAKGYVYSTAVRCLACRRQRRQMHGGQPNKPMKAAA